VRFGLVIGLLGILCGWLSDSANAERLYAIRPLSGYACMSLNLTEQQLGDNSVIVPILSKPSSTAQRVGEASSIIIAVSPLREVNGYVEVLRLDGGSGWIAGQYVKPWRNPGNSGRSCVPSLMSNGTPGFAFK